ncbi:MAG: OB-fold domain-containing protein [Dehalococcoidia bacterium]|nr:OB-fold domain-containing protein [Dehalococcoidia bacterium]
MLAGLKGNLIKIDIDENLVWLNVQNVIYELIVPQYSLTEFEKLMNDSEVFVYTYYHVSERNPLPIIVGFLTEKERNFFKKFIAVPGFGPVKAVRILTVSIDEIIVLIENQDTEGLTKLQGVGQQIAKTIVAKLNGKLIDLIPEGYSTNDTQRTSVDPLWLDAVDALIALDFNKRESERIIAQIRQTNPDLDTLELILRVALETKV